MPLVKAIESGIGQTESVVEILWRCGVVDFVTSSLEYSKCDWNVLPERVKVP